MMNPPEPAYWEDSRSTQPLSRKHFADLEQQYIGERHAMVAMRERARVRAVFARGNRNVMRTIKVGVILIGISWGTALILKLCGL